MALREKEAGRMPALPGNQKPKPNPVLKTLNRYIDGQPVGAGPLALLWSSAGRDRRFAFLLALSVVVHLIFYAALIKLDSWAMMRALAGGRHQTTLVKLIEIASPPERSTLHAAPESL